MVGAGMTSPGESEKERRGLVPCRVVGLGSMRPERGRVVGDGVDRVV